MTAIEVLLVAADDGSDSDAVALAIEAAREILNGDQEELGDDWGSGEIVDHRARIAFEVQLYLADRYNLSAIETTTIFTLALGETVAHNLKAEGSLDNVIAALLPTLKHAVDFRRANPLVMGLRDLIREYDRTGGKVRLS
jgi:hypothetical protein